VALPVFTDGPTSSTLGSVATIVGGAGSAHAATSDSNTATAVRIASTARLDSEKCTLGFTTPASIPAGAKILSVGIRRTIQTILTGHTAPTCLHWHRSLVPADPTDPLGSVATPSRDPFQTNLEKTNTTAWFTEELGDRRVTPDGAPWTLTGNLATFFYDFGYDGTGADPLLVAEVFRDITYQRISTVSVVGPTGTISGTRPTVTGSYASLDSQPIEAFQVAVYKQADTLVGGFVPFTSTPLQQSGWILSEDLQWQLTDDLVDGVYVAYIQGRAQWAGPGDFVTAVASGTFTRTASGTVAPNATLSSAVFDATNNRVALTMVPSSTSPTTVAFTVQASRDGGQSWQTRPSLTLIPATGMTPVVKYDRFFDVGVTMQYRVLSYAATTPNAAAAYSNTISVATYGDSWWIRHPQNPLLDTRVLPSVDGYKVTRPRVMGTHSVISRNGRVNKVVNYGSTYGDEGTVELLFNADEATLYAWNAYDQLDISNMTLFVQQPDGTSQWWALGPGSTGSDTKLELIPMPGSPGYLQRKLTTGFTETDPPSYF
jgi:hypothetical protein